MADLIVRFAGYGALAALGSAAWVVALERIIAALNLKRMCLEGYWHRKRCREPRIITKKAVPHG